MKNIQVIDGARNCAYDIFELEDEDFYALFGREGCDILFIDEISDDKGEILDKAWKNLVDKKFAKGIHGTLFYGLEIKKQFYPNRREQDLTDSRGRPQGEPIRQF